MAIAELPDLVATIVRSGRVTAEDVRRLEDQLFGEMLVEEEEAEWLFHIDRACAVKAPEWASFFFEGVVSVVVHQTAPRGALDDAKAAWLIGCVAEAGGGVTYNGLEAIVRVLEAADSAPVSLSVFALRQVGNSILWGEGPLAGRRHHCDGVVGEAETEVLRRVLSARSLREPLGRTEAEILFQLDEGSDEEGNALAWSELFVKALVSFLLPDAEGRAALAAGRHSRAAERLFASGEPRLAALWRSVAAGDADVRRSERSSAEDAKWLAGRIGRTGALRVNERLFLQVLFEEHPDLHPSLRTLVDTAA